MLFRANSEVDIVLVYCAAMSRARKAMVKKKAGSAAAREKVKVGAAAALPKLTKAEQDLVWHIEHGYRLETDSLGGDPVLRRLANDEVVRPASANRNTVKALEERGLIVQGKRSDPLKIVWRLVKKS